MREGTEPKCSEAGSRHGPKMNELGYDFDKVSKVEAFQVVMAVMCFRARFYYGPDVAKQDPASSPPRVTAVISHIKKQAHGVVLRYFTQLVSARMLARRPRSTNSV